MTLAENIDLIRSIAGADLSSAFSTWAHLMAIEYLSLAPAASRLAQKRLAQLRDGGLLGSTALASSTAAYLSGAPIPVTFRRATNGIVLNGRIAWASNLLPPFVSVTAAVHADDERRRIIVAFADDSAGVHIAPAPQLLGLQATGSSSIAFEEARLPGDAIVSDELDDFIGQVLPTFLLLQSSFCAGLGGRALREARHNLGAMRDILAPDLEQLDAAAARADGQLRSLSAHVRPREIPLADLLRLRLDWARLAMEAVLLELKAVGGRGYLASSPTARRLREAAFLPIQAPTEVQLRWALSASA